jgi:hypothetical protein
MFWLWVLAGWFLISIPLALVICNLIGFWEEGDGRTSESLRKIGRKKRVSDTDGLS